MQKITASSPALASRPEFAAISNLCGIDVIATRLWFDRWALAPPRAISRLLMQTILTHLDSATGFVLSRAITRMISFCIGILAIKFPQFGNHPFVVELTGVQIERADESMLVSRIGSNHCNCCCRRIPMRFPANVLSGFDETMGSTFFDLNALQVSWGLGGM